MVDCLVLSKQRCSDQATTTLAPVLPPYCYCPQPRGNTMCERWRYRGEHPPYLWGSCCRWWAPPHNILSPTQINNLQAWATRDRVHSERITAIIRWLPHLLWTIVSIVSISFLRKMRKENVLLLTWAPVKRMMVLSAIGFRVAPAVARLIPWKS